MINPINPMQYGGGRCALCQSPGTLKTTCPLNPDPKTKPNPAKHPLAAAAQPKQASPAANKKSVKESVKVKVKAKAPEPVKVKAKAPEPVNVKAPEAVKVKATDKDEASSASAVGIQPLEEAYLTSAGRMRLKSQFKSVIRNKEVLQCLNNQLDQFIKLDKRLGSGSFGIVHAGSSSEQKFAVKQGRTSMDTVKNPWSKKTDWSEALILRDVIEPLIQNRVCPNLPLIYEAYTCKTCEFEGLVGGSKKKTIKPCLILMMELASGDLSKWFKTKPTVPELFNALFQILAGLYAIHKNGQVVNNDIKAENILYYNVKVTPGSYWVYNIMGKRYYIPNIGKLFVVNDFGVSRALSVDHHISFGEDYFSAGTRYYTIINNTVVPYESDMHNWNRSIFTHNGTLRVIRYIKLDKKEKLEPHTVNLNDAQKAVMRANGLPTDPMDPKFYSNSDIIPPVELISDVLDALSMFIGNMPRASQEGKHEDHGLPADIKQALNPYLQNIVKVINRNNVQPDSLMYTDIRNIHPSMVHAGYMINELFGSSTPKFDFKTRPSVGTPIEEYTI